MNGLFKKLLRELRRIFRKSEEQRERELTSLIILFSKRSYERIKRLLKEINEESETFTLQPLKNNEIKVYKKMS